MRSHQDTSNIASILCSLAQRDLSYLDEALATTRSIQDAYSRAWGLIGLTKIDSAYLSESLEAVRSIQDTSDRAERVIDLAKIDSAYFPEALEATRSIQDESSRARRLIDLAKIDSAYFPEALEAARSIQDQSSRAWILSDLAESVPQDFLPILYSLITEITHTLSQSQALSNYISRVPLDRLPYTDWKTYLHLLAHRTRADLMGDLATLYPAILHLGGEDAGRGMVGEMGRVCRQWK